MPDAKVSDAHGVAVLDKPAGLSSARALRPVKRLAGRGTKVGHAGTLDPFATGVLLALVGDATRLSDLAMALPKTYVATVRFGRRTDTLDPEGAVVEERDPGPAPPPGLAEALPEGEIEQVPPAFSALKVEGRRAYQLARAGRPPELEARRVRVHAARILATRWPLVDVEVVCGAGFYVRSFARDLGRAVGLPACLDALRRTHVGPFAAAAGVAPEDFGLDRLRPLADLVAAAGVPVLDVERGAARAFAQGKSLRLACERETAVRTGDGLLVGLGRPGDGGLAPRVVFAAARRALEG